MTQGLLELTVSGRKVAGVRGGSGRPLLYLHSALGEAMWMPHLMALSRKFELVAPEHPGFGDSEGLDQIADMTDLVFHTLALMDALGWDTANVVGVSLGGWLAAELASSYPARVSRLVLASSVGIWLPDDPIADIFVLDLRFPERVVELNFHDPQCMMAQMLLQQIGPEASDEVIERTFKATAATAKLGWNPLLHNPRLAGRLHRITAPTLCLWGEYDRVVSPAYGRRFAELIPDARLELIADAGHLAFLEKTPQFVGAITRFLSEDPG